MTEPDRHAPENGVDSSRPRLPAFWNDRDAYLVLLLAMMMASGGMIANITGADPSDPAPLTFGSMTAMLLTPLCAAALVSHRALESRLSIRLLLGIIDPLRETLRGFCAGLATVPFAMAIAYVTGIAINAITGTPPVPQPVMESFRLPGTNPACLATAVLICVTLTPFAEEILYRGVLVSVLRLRHNGVYSVVLASVFFGLLHLHVPLIPSLSFVGAVFALLYLRTGSLLTAMAAHATFNATNLFLALQ